MFYKISSFTNAITCKHAHTTSFVCWYCKVQTSRMINEQFFKWCQAMITYCKETQISCRSIVKCIDLDKGNRCTHMYTLVHVHTHTHTHAQFCISNSAVNLMVTVLLKSVDQTSIIISYLLTLLIYLHNRHSDISDQIMEKPLS